MGAGPEQGQALAPCFGVAERVCSLASSGWSPALQPSLPKAPQVPHLPCPPPLHQGWPGSPLGCEQALPYLQTPVICTPICGQMASWLAPGHPCLEGGPPFRPVSGNLGWSPRWGVSQWRRPSPAPLLGLSTPEWRCLDIPFTRQESRPGSSSCSSTPSLAWSYSRLMMWARAGVVIPIEETEAQRGDVTCARTHSKTVALLGVKPAFLAPILASEKESPQTLCFSPTLP